MEKQIKIALAGNPNCGKTTLFNALTGSNQFVGNWPGVTELLGDAHIHDTALDGALAMELDDFDGLANFDFTQSFHNLSPFI